jgi:hypothetical protein
MFLVSLSGRYLPRLRPVGTHLLGLEVAYWKVFDHIMGSNWTFTKSKPRLSGFRALMCWGGNWDVETAWKFRDFPSCGVLEKFWAYQGISILKQMVGSKMRLSTERVRHHEVETAKK